MKSLLYAILDRWIPVSKKLIQKLSLNFWRLILLARTKRTCFLYLSILVSFLVAKPCVAGTTKVTLAYFTFEASQPSYSAPSNTWYTNLVAESGPGTGTASALHQGACDYSCPTGNRSDHSFGANSWNVGDFWQFACSSLGASGITVSFDLVGSATGPAEYELEYSTDGSLFINSGTIIAAALNGELPGMKPF